MGGRRESRRPISVGQIIQVLEGGLSLVDCVDDAKVCEREKNCPTRDIWLRMSERLMEELSSLTLRDVLDGKRLPA